MVVSLSSLTNSPPSRARKGVTLVRSTMNRRLSLTVGTRGPYICYTTLDLVDKSTLQKSPKSSLIECKSTRFIVDMPMMTPHQGVVTLLGLGRHSPPIYTGLGLVSYLIVGTSVWKREVRITIKVKGEKEVRVTV